MNYLYNAYYRGTSGIFNVRKTLERTRHEDTTEKGVFRQRPARYTSELGSHRTFFITLKY